MTNTNEKDLCESGVVENFTTRKRFVDAEILKKENKFTLYEQVYTISTFRQNIPRLGDAVSISLRVAALADLVLIEAIETRNNKVYTKDTSIIQDNVLDKIYSMIKNTDYDPKELLLALNGESYTKGKYQMHVKHLRSKIEKSLEERGFLRRGKKTYKLFRQKAVLSDYIKEEARKEVMECLEGKNDSIRGEVLVACLSYCNALCELFFSLEPKRVTELKERAKLIEQKYKSPVERSLEPEKTIGKFLKIIYTL